MKKAHGKMVVDMDKTQKKMDEKSVNKKTSENQARGSFMISKGSLHISQHMKKRFNARLKLKKKI